MGWSPFRYKEWRCWANCLAVSFQRFPTYVITVHQRHRRTDDMRSQNREFALKYWSALRGKKFWIGDENCEVNRTETLLQILGPPCYGHSIHITRVMYVCCVKLLCYGLGHWQISDFLGIFGTKLPQLWSQMLKNSWLQYWATIPIGFAVVMLCFSMCLWDKLCIYSVKGGQVLMVIYNILLKLYTTSLRWWYIVNGCKILINSLPRITSLCRFRFPVRIGLH